LAIFLITAPSGAGKTETMKLVAKYTGNIGECISDTTRPMRKGEQNGFTYYFRSGLEFETMVDNGEFAEQVEYDGNLYGIRKSEINRVLGKHKHVYIIVEYGGYTQVKEAYPDAVGIFLHMGKEDCLANMLLRGDTMEKALKRIATYEDEMANRHEYDYVIKNVRGKMDATARVITAITQQYGR
jgi:guanylate kinase